VAIRNILVASLIFMCFASCDQDSIYDNYQTISGGWSINEPVVFTIKELDTVQKYDLFVTLRNTNEYAYNNLFLITTLDFPNGRKRIDTLEYAMAEPDGTWLGKGFNDVKESKLWYREGERFRESGTYTINISHAVRKNGNVSGDAKLKGITEVGVRIEHSKN
jgi:gliding motility-associated lipoprotein GldH